MSTAPHLTPGRLSLQPPPEGTGLGRPYRRARARSVAPSRPRSARTHARRFTWFLVGVGVSGAIVSLIGILALVLSGFVSPLSRQGIEPDDAIGSVYRQALPGVVQVIDWSRSGQGTRQEILGSGFVVDLEGHVLTNLHVIRGVHNPGIVLPDGSRFQADVVGLDPSHDLAVLEAGIPRERLHPLAFGDSSRLEVGQRVVAIGSPFALAESLSSGVVSFVGRPFAVYDGDPLMNTIQTDAAINPGNSGGPLLDMNGQVVGVISSAYAKAIGRFEGGSVGVGFAIPSDDARRALPEMIGGSLAAQPWLGVFARDVGSTTVSSVAGASRRGAMIVQVLTGGPADRAGLIGEHGLTLSTSIVSASSGGEMADGIDESGDVVTEIDGRAVKSSDDLVVYLAGSGKRVGDIVRLRIQREGQVLEVPVRLSARDEDQVGAI